MNKFELVEVVVKEVGIIKVVVDKVLLVIIGVVVEIVLKGEFVILVGFGIFKFVQCVVCIGKNFKIGDMLKILVIMVFKFFVGIVFKVVVVFKKFVVKKK